MAGQKRYKESPARNLRPDGGKVRRPGCPVAKCFNALLSCGTKTADERPLSADEIATKFRSNAELTFASERVDRVLDAIMDLDGKSTPAEVAELLNPA